MSSSVRNFIRHYLEMVAAMLLGMVALGVPALLALGTFGVSRSELYDDAPTLALLGMAVAMTVPMVAWMRHRGHGWAPCADMTAAMFLPTLAVLVPLWAGLTDDVHALMMVEHIAMGPAMLVAMLLRRDEYTGAHDGHAMRSARAQRGTA